MWPEGAGPPHELGVEQIRERAGHDVFDVLHHDFAVELAGQRGDGLVADPTGDDHVEVREVGVHVEREAVHGDPAADSNADRADLAVADPGAVQARDPRRGDAQVGARANHRLFEQLHVAADVTAVGVEVDDRVADELAGAVVGDVAAAAGLVDFEAARAEELGRHEHVIDLGGATQREDRLVLEQEQRVRDLAALPRGLQALLELVRGPVGDATEPMYVERAHERSCGRIALVQRSFTGGASIALVALVACGGDDGAPGWLAPAPGDPLRVRHLADDPVTGHGVGVEDLDGDGLLDVVVTTGRGPVRAFHNSGDLRFDDATEVWGLGGLEAYDAVAVRDVDGDRAPDVVLASFDGVRLFRNDGSGRLADATVAAGLDDTATLQPVHVLVADLDLDGRSDIFVSSYGGANQLLRQESDGTFTEIAAAAGLGGEELTWCASLWDHDADGELSLYLATDTLEEDVHGGPEWSADRTSPLSDRLYRRDTAASAPTFTDISVEARIDVPRSTMGALVTDLDRDGLLDLFTTDYGRNHALRGGPSLDYVTADLGLDDYLRDGCPEPDDPSFCALVSWGAARFDADGDGVEDLVVANGGLEQDWRGPQPVSAYHGLASGGYEPVSLGLPLMNARALVAADLDDDGDDDAIVSEWNGALVVLEAPGPAKGHYLVVRLVGRAAGAVVRVELDDGTSRIASVASGGIIQSSRPARVTFGLGGARPVAVGVRWPSGAEERIEAPPVDGGRIDLYEP